MKTQRDERVVSKIRESGKRYFIIAQAGVGKSTAVSQYPEIMADVDCFLMRRLPTAPPPPAPLEREHRDPDFPVNYVRAVVRAFEKYLVVVSPVKGNWAVEPAIDLVSLLANSDARKVKDYVRYCAGINAKVLSGENFPDTPEFNADVERLTAEMMPLLEKLRGIKFVAALTMPDEKCVAGIISNIESRDKIARQSGKMLGQEFRGMAREIEAQKEVGDVLKNRFGTGLFLKIPMHKGQFFGDAFNDAILGGA
jgi:hypothetical protein